MTKLKLNCPRNHHSKSHVWKLLENSNNPKLTTGVKNYGQEGPTIILEKLRYSKDFFSLLDCYGFWSTVSF